MTGSENQPNSDINAQSQEQNKSVSNRRGWRFWVILGSFCIASLLASIEATVISTALSTIVADLDIGDNYPWVVNSYMLAGVAVQPMLGQLANLYGRRWITIISLGLLLLGSGVCGGATNGDMLIAGRTLQGVGGGGINMLIELIVCDLVPLRERPKFMAIIFMLFAVGTSIGPFLGGVLVQDASWRWVFYINLPIGGVAIVLLYLFFHMNHKRTTFKESIGRFDWFGSFLVITAAIAVLFALTYGGARYPWSSWRIIVPLVLGLIGILGFHAYEASPWVADPLLPPHLFGNRTSAIGFLATFMQTFLFTWVIYFLPIYFQAVLGSSATRSGVQMLPTVTVMIPFAIAGGQFVAKTGRYKPVHIFGLGVTAIGIGLFSTIDAGSSMGMWVGLQILHIAGAGTVTTALLPSIQASLSDDDNASSAAAFAYIRSYGSVWGITIPVAVFNNQFENHAHWITDLAIRELFSAGDAYSLGNKAFLSTLDSVTRQEVVSVFEKSLETTWYVGAALAAATTLVTFFEKEVELRTELNTEYGIKESNEKDKEAVAETGSTSPAPTSEKSNEVVAEVGSISPLASSEEAPGRPNSKGNQG